MRNLFVVFIMQIVVICVYSQDKTILITESNLPYSEQTWFYAGSGKALQESLIKSNWDGGKRIISAAYTNNGWFVTMAKNTGIGMQTYRLSQEWPKDWITEKWSDNYRITSISRSDKSWLIVMSQGTGYSQQSYNRTDWPSMSKWIKEKWDDGYYITHSCYNGNVWTVVMSKHSSISFQGYLWASNKDDLNSKIKTKVWDNGYNIQLIEYGVEFFVVYCKYNDNNNRGQNYIINPSDVKDYIQKRWDNSYNVAYIGGGYPNVLNSNSNVVSNVNNKHNNLNSWRQELIGGGYCDYVLHEDGSLSTTEVKPCFACHGTKTCQACFGSGGRWMSYTGMYYPCTMCLQTGRCSACKGEGYITTTGYTKNGNSVLHSSNGYSAQGGPGGIIVTDPNGHSTGHLTGGGEDYRNKTDSNKSSKSGVCPSCNGRKYDSTPYKYAAASTSGARQPYHHHSGARCTYCNSVTDHYHYPCSSCMGTGRL